MKRTAFADCIVFFTPIHIAINCNFLALRRFSVSSICGFMWFDPFNALTAFQSAALKLHKSALIFVVLHRGLVGSAVVSRLRRVGYTNLILCSYSELDLTIQSAVKFFFSIEKPQFVIHVAAKVRMIEVGRLLMSEDWWIGDLRSKGTVDNSNKLQRGIMMGPAQHRTSLWESNEVVLWRSLGSRIFVLRK